MPEEENKEKMGEIVIPPEVLVFITNVALKSTLVVVANFLKQAVNTKVKVGNNTLREPTAREVVDITIGLIENAVVSMDQAEQEAKKNAPDQVEPKQEKEDVKGNA